MAINLGEDPNLLILISFAEILFILVPSLIAAKIEKNPFIVEVKELGFNVKNSKLKNIILKILAGILIGIFFFFISDLLLTFYMRFIIQNLFGAQVIEDGIGNAISTQPMNPNFIQLSLLIVVQIIIIGPCEEAFFRGFVINKSKYKIKVIYSIILSSFLFAIYHVPPFLVPLTTIITFFGYYFTFGILLSLVFVAFKGSILPSSIAHSSLNILLLIF
ncbi:MAG: CPBP family intramembrane metalloprotease [Candidatus Lokiarchaeota archaeon]|nr:CPBP family intramembrane metalloprotease [Candidatus Lokiarchaeota archaeon]